MTLQSPLDFISRFAAYQLRPSLQHLVLHVTGRCNFRCKHCFVDTAGGPDLPLAAYQQLGQQVGRIFWLDIGGGEPFLRRDLAEIIAAFEARIIQIPSNGSLPEQMIEQIGRLQKIWSGELVISLSLDGLETTHDRIRQPGSYAKLWSTFAKLRERTGVPIKINTVLQKENAAEIIPLMKEVRKKQPDFHSIILLRGLPNNPSAGLPDLIELERLGPEILAMQGTYDYGRSPVISRFLRTYHRYLWEVSLRTIREQRQVIPCRAGQVHLAIWGDGRVASCEMLEPVGSISDQNFNSIMTGPDLKDQIATIKAGCCHCTHNCALLDSILFNPQEMAKLCLQSLFATG